MWEYPITLVAVIFASLVVAARLLWVVVGHAVFMRQGMGPQQTPIAIEQSSSAATSQRLLMLPRTMRGGTRLPGPRRLLRSLATWGVTRQKKALQVALLDHLRPDHTWTPRQTRRWWRRGFTKMARQTQQQREAQVQTVGVSYQHPDYFEEAKKKGLVLYMDHRYGANQRFPVKVTKGRVPITAAYPQGAAHTVWVTAEGTWWDARTALARVLKLSPRNIWMEHEGRGVDLNQPLPRHTFDADGHLVLTLRRRSREDAGAAEAKPKPTTNPYARARSRSRARSPTARPSRHFASPSSTQAPHIDRERRQQEDEELHQRIRRLHMQDASTQTDPEVDHNDLDTLQIVILTAGTMHRGPCHPCPGSSCSDHTRSDRRRLLSKIRTHS